MKIISSILLLFFFNQSSYCQSQYSLGIMASPDFTYINGNKIAKDYTTIPGYKFGITFYKKISKNFFITSGIWYDKKGIKQSILINFYDSTGAIIKKEKGTYYHKYKDLEMPLFIYFMSGKSRLKFCISTGFSFGFAIRETVTFSSPSSTNIYNVKSNRTLPDRINFCFSMGVLYKINYKYALFIEPNYKIDVRAIYETLLDDSHSYGLRTTLIYKFKY